MIYITGDCHGEFTKFSSHNFPEQKEMTKKDIVIILGDFGGVWHDSPEERYWLDWLNNKPFTVCYVDGNHENYDRYYSEEFDVVDFYGGKAQRIRDSVYHLMRGYVFEFENKKFFCMGGASSHDISDGILQPDDLDTIRLWERQNKSFRVEHISWWKEEIPSKEEMNIGLKTLAENNFEVDYVISHALPFSVSGCAGFFDSDDLSKYLDSLLNENLKFKHWFCGHYHMNERVLDKYTILYENIMRIE